MAKRVFLIVLDSFGIGAMPDADQYGDAGSNTLAAVCGSKYFSVPNLAALGLFNIQGVTCGKPEPSPRASFARLAEYSSGKDTTIGHWELAGIHSYQQLPTYPEGFPDEIVADLEKHTGCRMLCNRPYSGTEVLEDFGQEHMASGGKALILYTSADSVLQIAAHEELVPVEQLYRICEMARGIMQGEHGVGRIIARPFAGEPGSFRRTANRHDFSLQPPAPTVCDYLEESGREVIGVGKIFDIFAGHGITRSYKTAGNDHGMQEVLRLVDEDFSGLCFVNLVDFDMLYGHRNDPDGYAAALTAFDEQLGRLLPLLRADDLLLLTADHGCDPATPSTDHSREYVPMLAMGQAIRQGVDLGTRSSFSDIAATVQEYFSLPIRTQGESFLQSVLL